MNSYEEIKKMLNDDGFISCNKKLAWRIGMRATILYSELLSRFIYFKNKGKLTRDGFFFNTIPDLQKATTLTGKQQRKEMKQLKKLGLVEQNNRGMPKIRYFKIIPDMGLIEKLLSESQYCSLLSKVGLSESDIFEHTELPKMPTNKNHLKRNINKKKLNGLLSESVNEKFFISVIEYYLDNYENYMGEEHPVLKNEYWKKVIDSIYNFMREWDIDDYDDLCIMIDAYYKQDIKCDRNILHFATEGIMINRMYETLY